MANRMPSVTLTGADGLIELLRTIPEKQLLPAVNKGLREVGTKTMRDARKRLRKGHGLRSGALKRSLGVRSLKTYKKEGRVVMYLGPRKGFAVDYVADESGGFIGRHVKKKGKVVAVRAGYSRKHDPFYIAHLVEFGHKTAGSSRSVMSRAFLRPAVDSNKAEFNKQMVAKISSVLEKAKASGK